MSSYKGVTEDLERRLFNHNKWSPLELILKIKLLWNYNNNCYKTKDTFAVLNDMLLNNQWLNIVLKIISNTYAALFTAINNFISVFLFQSTYNILSYGERNLGND